MKKLILSALLLLTAPAAAQQLTIVQSNVSTGTWTPTDQSGGSLTFSNVHVGYTKIGNLVTIYGNFHFPVTADANGILIGGLPFTVANNSYARAPIVFVPQGLSTSPVCLFVVNSTELQCYIAGLSATLHNDALSDSDVYISGSYTVQ